MPFVLYIDDLSPFVGMRPRCGFAPVDILQSLEAADFPVFPISGPRGVRRGDGLLPRKDGPPTGRRLLRGGDFFCRFGNFPGA